MLDKVIDSGPCLDEKHNLARPFQFGDELLDGMSALDVGPLGFILKEMIDFASGSIVCYNNKSLVVHVKDQILTHDGKADETDIAGSHCAQSMSRGGSG